jgi:hypothetical protein
MPKKPRKLSKPIPGQCVADAQEDAAGIAAADQAMLDAQLNAVGGGTHSVPGQRHADTQSTDAGIAAADHSEDDTQATDVGGGTSPIAKTCARIHAYHVKRKYAIKLQQKIDRALEAYVRINETDWSPDLPEAEREKINKEVARIIKAARDGNGGDEMLVELVRTTDLSREPIDVLRLKCEKIMTSAAGELPVAEWIENVHGAGVLGLATIIGEAYSIHRPGGLEQYDNPGKLWKRLGFAPYDGHAGSTWKRETWRPRALSSEEWIANPFSGARYAPMRIMATWLINHQITAAAKSEDGIARATGPYGEIYLKRRAHTATTHSDWTPGHSQSDAIRYTMKRFLADLWRTWHDEIKKTSVPGQPVNDAQVMLAGKAAADQPAPDIHRNNVGGGTNSNSPALSRLSSSAGMPGTAADHTSPGTHRRGVGGGTNSTNSRPVEV